MTSTTDGHVPPAYGAGAPDETLAEAWMQFVYRNPKCDDPMFKEFFEAGWKAATPAYTAGDRHPYVLCRTHGVVRDLCCAECRDVEGINARRVKMEHDHMNCPACRIDAAADFVDRAERDADRKKFGAGVLVPTELFRQLIGTLHAAPAYTLRAVQPDPLDGLQAVVQEVAMEEMKKWKDAKFTAMYPFAKRMGELVVEIMREPSKAPAFEATGQEGDKGL